MPEQINEFLGFGDGGKKIPHVSAADLNRESLRIVDLIISELYANKSMGVIKSSLLNGSIDFEVIPYGGQTLTHKFRPSQEYITTLSFKKPKGGIEGDIKRRDIAHELYSLLIDKMHKAEKPAAMAGASSNTIEAPRDIATATDSTEDAPEPDRSPLLPKKDKNPIADSIIRMWKKTRPNKGFMQFKPKPSIMIYNIQNKRDKSVDFILPVADKNQAKTDVSPDLLVKISNYSPDDLDLLIPIIDQKTVAYLNGDFDKAEPLTPHHAKKDLVYMEKLATKILGMSIFSTNLAEVNTTIQTDIGDVRVIAMKDGKEFECYAYPPNAESKTPLQVILTIPKTKITKEQEDEAVDKLARELFAAYEPKTESVTISDRKKWLYESLIGVSDTKKRVYDIAGQLLRD